MAGQSLFVVALVLSALAYAIFGPTLAAANEGASAANQIAAVQQIEADMRAFHENLKKGAEAQCQRAMAADQRQLPAEGTFIQTRDRRRIRFDAAYRDRLQTQMQDYCTSALRLGHNLLEGMKANYITEAEFQSALSAAEAHAAAGGQSAAMEFYRVWRDNYDPIVQPKSQAISRLIDGPSDKPEAGFAVRSRKLESLARSVFGYNLTKNLLLQMHKRPVEMAHIYRGAIVEVRQTLDAADRGMRGRIVSLEELQAESTPTVTPVPGTLGGRTREDPKAFIDPFGIHARPHDDFVSPFATPSGNATDLGPPSTASQPSDEPVVGTSVETDHPDFSRGGSLGSGGGGGLGGTDADNILGGAGLGAGDLTKGAKDFKLPQDPGGDVRRFPNANETDFPSATTTIEEDLNRAGDLTRKIYCQEHFPKMDLAECMANPPTIE